MNIPNGIHGVGNAVEAIFWGVAGLSMIIAAVFKGNHRMAYSLSALVFVLFGFSDVVEISTGAWWRPWWLLLWKATCIITLLILWYTSRRPLL